MAAGERSNRSNSGCHRMGKAITTAIVWLLLGAIVNIAVAWGIACWAQSDSDAWNPFLWSERRTQELGTGDLRWPQPPPEGWPARPMQRSGERRPYFERDWRRAEADTAEGIERLREYARAGGYDYIIDYANAMHVADGNIDFAGDFVRVGWPMLTLSGERFEHQFKQRAVNTSSSLPMQGSSVRFAIELPVPAGPNAWMLRGDLLPLRPIWPGFAINTVFYAAIVWGLFAVPRALRRWSRSRRGLCPTCAYDLRGSKDTVACPECGAAAPIARAP